MRANSRHGLAQKARRRDQRPGRCTSNYPIPRPRPTHVQHAGMSVRTTGLEQELTPGVRYIVPAASDQVQRLRRAAGRRRRHGSAGGAQGRSDAADRCAVELDGRSQAVSYQGRQACCTCGDWSNCAKDDVSGPRCGQYKLTTRADDQASQVEFGDCEGHSGIQV